MFIILYASVGKLMHPLGLITIRGMKNVLMGMLCVSSLFMLTCEQDITANLSSLKQLSIFPHCLTPLYII